METKVIPFTFVKEGETGEREDIVYWPPTGSLLKSYIRRFSGTIPSDPEGIAKFVIDFFNNTRNGGESKRTFVRLLPQDSF